MGKIHDAFNRKMERYFINDQGEFSLVGLSGAIGTIAGLIVMASTIDIGFTIPTVVVGISKLILTAGIGGVVVGYRAAMKK